MFDMDETTKDSDDSQVSMDDSNIKRRKCETDFYHSSLDHHSVRVPPIVEYPSIHKYSEMQNETLLALDNLAESSSPSSGLDDFMSVSSPIVLKTPKTKMKISLGSNLEPPYSYFSLEELSLVKSLKNWHSTKVCVVGRIIHKHDTQQFYLQSVVETGSWKVMLDTSLLKTIPTPNTSLQCFGDVVMEILPSLRVHFFRYLKLVDLTLLIDSYRLLENFTPMYASSTSMKITDDNNKNSEENKSKE